MGLIAEVRQPRAEAVRAFANRPSGVKRVGAEDVAFDVA